MIGYLNGTIIHKERKGNNGHAIVDVNGVGYKVAVTTDILNALREGNATQLWIYSAVREDAFDLYGFTDKESLSFFELLITISGIGPRSALGILSAAPISSIREAVISGETSYLTKISGIGKKIADKIVLELKDKITANEGESEKASAISGDVDALEALKSLGYTHKESRDALEEVPSDVKNPAEKVKYALRVLGK